MPSLLHDPLRLGCALQDVVIYNNEKDDAFFECYADVQFENLTLTQLSGYDGVVQVGHSNNGRRETLMKLPGSCNLQEPKCQPPLISCVAPDFARCPGVNHLPTSPPLGLRNALLNAQCSFPCTLCGHRCMQDAPCCVTAACSTPCPVPGYGTRARL